MKIDQARQVQGAGTARIRGLKKTGGGFVTGQRDSQGGSPGKSSQPGQEAPGDRDVDERRLPRPPRGRICRTLGAGENNGRIINAVSRMMSRCWSKRSLGLAKEYGRYGYRIITGLLKPCRMARQSQAC